MWEAGLFTDPENEHVHHKDHNGLNNDFDNLEVLTNKEHRRQHALEDGITNQFGHHSAQSLICKLDGCERPSSSNSMCVAHVTRYRRYGNPLLVKRVTPETVEPYELIS